MSHLDIPVIITRAEPGALETANRLERMGLSAIVSPVLIMQTRAQVALPVAETLAGLVFTSANGVRAYSARREDRTLPAWCVGPATATAAREADFENVHESAGNAVDLAEFIARNSSPGPRPLLHVANGAAKGDLKRALTGHGFETVFTPLYDMFPAEQFSDPADGALSAHKPSVVLIHSAKGAQRFAELCPSGACEHIAVAAISEFAAWPLKDLDFNRIQIASSPNEDGLFEALEAVLATLSA